VRALDPDIGRAVALVVDGNPSSRGVLTQMLKDCGVGNVVQGLHAHEARRLLEHRRFDIVLCEYHFDNEPMTGLEVIDDLRQASLLPLSTVVVMISSEAAYGHVAEAAEAALDAYVIKPHTEAALRDRLMQARQRKRTMADIFALVDAEKFEEAAELAQTRAELRGPAWVHAARVAAELWLRLKRPSDAVRMLEAIMQTGALPWARLGLARAHVEAGAVFQARRTLESLLGDHPGYADAYDVMGRVLLDQGENWKAIEALKRATELTPNSISRLVKLGLLIFYFGDPREAATHLEQAVRLGVNSRVFDLQGLVLLAALQFDRGDRRGLALSFTTMKRMRAEAPKSPRLRRFEAAIGILNSLAQRRVPEAVLQLNEMLAESMAPDFEFEAACNLLIVLSRVERAELHMPELADHVVRVAERFAVSRTTTDLLCGSLRGDLEITTRIRDAYAKVGEVAERAVSLTVERKPRESVLLLLEHAQRTLNAKLTDMAIHTVERHKAAIEGADALLTQAMDLRDRYASYGTQVRLARIDDARSMVAASRTTPPTVPGPAKS